MNTKSVNRVHTSSLECIRSEKKSQPSEQSKTIVTRVIYICSASLIQQTMLFMVGHQKACPIFRPTHKIDSVSDNIHENSERMRRD